MVPIDHSFFDHSFFELMSCSLQMVYRSTEELTIRSNGKNRNLLPMARLVSVF